MKDYKYGDSVDTSGYGKHVGEPNYVSSPVSNDRIVEVTVPVETIVYQVIENFEDANLATTFTGAWTRVSGTTQTGTWSLVSNDIIDSATTDETFSVVTSTSSSNNKMEVIYKVSSEANYDMFEILVDGVVKHSDSGDNGLWETVTIPLAALKTYAIIFRFRKDVSVTIGTDDVRIDKITLIGDTQFA